MDKFFTIRFPAITLAVAFGVVFTSCAGEKKNTESVKTEETVVFNEEPEEETPEYVLTKQGIGPIETNMKVMTWPAEAPGLYNRVETSEGEDADQYEFYLDERPMVTALDFGSGHVDLIILSDDSLKCKPGDDDRTFTMKDSFSEFLTASGAKGDFASMDDIGMWYWTSGGLWFAPAQEHLSKKTTDKLYNEGSRPGPADFSEETTIGYIATGLPF